MTQTKEMTQFAELTDKQLTFIERLQIGDAFVTKEQADVIDEVLGLEGMTREELTAVRNSVVKHLSTLASVMRDIGSMKSYYHYHNAMSGIVTVIDSHAYVDCYFRA